MCEAMVCACVVGRHRIECLHVVPVRVSPNKVHPPPLQATTICLPPPPAVWPFEPVAGVVCMCVWGGTPTSQDEPARWQELGLIWPKEGLGGCCPSPEPPATWVTEQATTLSLAPPGCSDPWPWAPLPVAFCCPHINHPAGQGPVRE